MSRMMDADKFLSWLSEVEGEIRKEKMKDCQPDRYDDGLMAATGTIREYVEKMCKIDEAEAMEKLAEFEEKEKCGEWLDAIELAKIAIALQSQKHIPVKPIILDVLNGDIDYVCPLCDKQVMSDAESRNNYCGEFGCKFDWSEIDETN